MPHPLRSTRGAGPIILVSLVIVSGCQLRRPPERQLSPVQEEEAAQTREQASGVNSLSGSEIDRMRYQRFEQMLEGRVPGVQVINRGNGRYSVRIRGAGNFQGNGDPLFLLDGVEISPSALGTINPADVERIQVIKDGTAAAWGIQGANGVILITTIRPD